MKKLVLASNNAKKMKELNALLAPLGFEVIPQGQLGIPEAEEPYCTFVENALAKARHAAKHSGLPALADDSGLCVAALGGAPGVYSARYAGEPKSDARNNEKLLAELAGQSDRRRSSPKASGTAPFLMPNAAPTASAMTRCSMFRRIARRQPSSTARSRTSCRIAARRCRS